MKNPKKFWKQAPMAAIALGAVLLLGVLLSFRFVLAILAISLIGWGVYGCTKG